MPIIFRKDYKIHSSEAVRHTIRRGDPPNLAMLAEKQLPAKKGPGVFAMPIKTHVRVSSRRPTPAVERRHPQTTRDVRLEAVALTRSTLSQTHGSSTRSMSRDWPLHGWMHVDEPRKDPLPGSADQSDRVAV